MNPVPGSAGKPLLVSRNAARGAFAKALNLYVGRGRRYSVKELSNATGVPDRVIECAKVECEDADSRNTPLEAVLSIASFLGAEFTASWLALAGQGAFDLPSDDDPNPGQVAADNADDNAEVARAARDGIFDNEERQHLHVVGSRMVARGTVLCALKPIGSTLAA